MVGQRRGIASSTAPLSKMKSLVVGSQRWKTITTVRTVEIDRDCRRPIPFTWITSKQSISTTRDSPAYGHKSWGDLLR